MCTDFYLCSKKIAHFSCFKYPLKTEMYKQEREMTV